MSRIVNETHNTSSFVLQSSDKGGGGDESKDGHDEDVEPVLAVGHTQVARHNAGNEALSQAEHPIVSSQHGPMQLSQMSYNDDTKACYGVGRQHRNRHIHHQRGRVPVLKLFS